MSVLMKNKFSADMQLDTESAISVVHNNYLRKILLNHKMYPPDLQLIATDEIFKLSGYIKGDNSCEGNTKNGKLSLIKKYISHY